MHQLDTIKSPEQMAAGLAHLDGFIWMDSSGNLRPDDESAISIITALPLEKRTGDIRKAAELRASLDCHQDAPQAPIDGIPNGGWFGTIDYDGRYQLGLYREIVAFHHASGTWFEQGQLSSQWRTPSHESAARVGDFTGKLSQAQFERAVDRIHRYIRSGDLYQVNLCHQFQAELDSAVDSFSIYQALRECSPAPMSAFLKQSDRDILSSSPETFLKFSGDQVMTRPIKGTRPRFQDPLKDQQSAFELRTSEKEIAELVMITDLMRNDIGQVCKFGQVQVSEMLKLESYEQVYHLVSTVTGTLREDIDALDCLAACFPGGSITGAPKKRSMEVIEEIEQGSRGLYTGSIGYLGFNGESQFNIAIRTLVREGDRLHFHVGAGIVADSEPSAEYQETLHKAEGMRLAVQKIRERA